MFYDVVTIAINSFNKDTLECSAYLNIEGITNGDERIPWRIDGHGYVFETNILEDSSAELWFIESDTYGPTKDEEPKNYFHHTHVDNPQKYVIKEDTSYNIQLKLLHRHKLQAWKFSVEGVKGNSWKVGTYFKRVKKPTLFD